ncbi:MAG: hypothetical protein II982_00045 [Clostridia bacterium]|nr:hypothetical protein [Clostridia bacterium]
MKRTKYTPMKGADFTNEPALVDNDRAPICENIIPDKAGYPEKRPGWRVENEYEGKIYGLHKYTFGGVTKMLVHEGTRLWCEDTLLCEDMAENVSRSYQNEDDLIILDGQNYRVYSEKTGAKNGVPYVFRNKKDVVLAYNRCGGVSKVERVYTGTDKYTYTTRDELITEGKKYAQVNGNEGIVEMTDIADGSIYNTETEGWYVWLITHVGGETAYTLYSYSVNEYQPADNTAYLELDDTGYYVVIKVKETTKRVSVNRINFAYVGENDTEYDEEKPLQGLKSSGLYINENDKILLTETGYYRFVLEYTVTEAPYVSHYASIFTFFVDPTVQFWLRKITADDTIDLVVSKDKYTDNHVYIPTTSISNSAVPLEEMGDYAVMNGVAYEKANKLGKWRRMTVCGASESEGYFGIALEDKPIYEKIPDNSTAAHVRVTNFKVFVNGEECSVVTRESENASLSQVKLNTACNSTYMNNDGKRTKASFYLVTDYVENDYIKIKPAGNALWLVYNQSSIDARPLVVGRDNIEIYYVAEADEDTDIAKCTVISEYDNALFVTGNPDKPNFDWHSYVENPYYFPDLNYQKFGDNTEILGYVNTGEYQAIVKAEGAAGGSIYIRSVAEFNGERAYPVKQMASGVGGVSKDGFCSLIGDDLMLTKQGIFAFTTIDMTGEKTLSNRSWYVDGKLTKENLSNANMFVWQGKCMCVVEDRIYILNAESSMSRNHKYDTLYDCYYWTGVPMERVLVINDELFFSNGCKVCRLNTDKDEKERYNDNGTPIIARWATKLDDDGDITRYKTMIKKGNTVTVKPYARSSAKVYVRTENDVEKEVKYGTADIFSWENIDFSKLTFLTSKTLREIIVNSKVKKYKRLQFIIENDALDEGFGVIEINKHFAYQNFIKR